MSVCFCFSLQFIAGILVGDVMIKIIHLFVFICLYTTSLALAGVSLPGPEFPRLLYVVSSASTFLVELSFFCLSDGFFRTIRRIKTCSSLRPGVVARICRRDDRQLR